MSLLERSKATLARLDIISHEPERDADCFSKSRPSMRFCNSFPNLERLNLTKSYLPEALERTPSVLTMLGSNWFFESKPWSQEELKMVSSLQSMAIRGQPGWANFKDEDEVDDLHVMTEVFQACSQTLVNLSIVADDNGPHDLTPTYYSLPKLTSLEIIGESNFEDLLNCSLPSLVSLEVQK